MKQTDWLDKACDDAKSEYDREIWRVGRWVVPIGLALFIGGIAVQLLRG